MIVDNKNNMVTNNKNLKYEAIECYDDIVDYEKECKEVAREKKKRKSTC